MFETSSRVALSAKIIRAAVMLGVFVLITAACSDDSNPSGDADNNANPDNNNGLVLCNIGEYYDEATDSCLDSPPADAGNNGGDDTGPGDVGTDTSETPDAGDDVDPDVTEDEPIDPACDQDNDGALSFACGGNDCDDNNFRRAPGRDEVCDAIDNNCNAENNEGIDCTFYAHTGEQLYRVDPFRKIAVEVADVPNLFDIDTHPNGTLYGITADRLYRFDDASGQWFLLGSFPDIEGGTGLAIDSTGTAFMTAEDKLYTVDLVTAQTRQVGTFGGDFFSSGDCVINKSDTIFMTSKDFDVPDELVILDRNSGRATLVGSVGFTGVFALTFGWGQLYGLNSRGELIAIDSETGQGTLVHVFEGLRWYGAASTPGR